MNAPSILSFSLSNQSCVPIHFISFHFRSTYINTYIYFFYRFLRILKFTHRHLNPRIARVHLQTYLHTKFWRSSLRGSVKEKKYFLLESSNTTHCFHFEFAYWVIYCITIRFTTLHHLPPLRVLSALTLIYTYIGRQSISFHFISFHFISFCYLVTGINFHRSRWLTQCYIET